MGAHYNWDPGRIEVWFRDPTNAMLPGYTYEPHGPGGVPCLSYRPILSELVKCTGCGALMPRSRATCRICNTVINEERRQKFLQQLKGRAFGSAG